MNEETELLPCPFCESKAEFYQSSWRTCGHGESVDDVGVRCTRCSANYLLNNYSDCQVRLRKETAMKAWNKRIR